MYTKRILRSLKNNFRLQVVLVILMAFVMSALVFYWYNARIQQLNNNFPTNPAHKNHH
ncbi:MAG: hypothetical protein ACK41O_08665 [Runella zeae]